MDAKNGLRVNGEKIKLKGVNLHHGLGAIGAAWNKGLMKQRMLTLKEIGCNAIRTCHNPPASELLDLCDEMGFLVMDEAFDKWKTLRYGLIFDECWQEDLLEMINRDRNHPCVFCWSVGNEVHNQAKEDMLKTLAMLAERTKQEDPSRPVTYAMEPHVFDDEQRKMSPAEKAKLTQKIEKHVDIVSGNYHEQYYDEYHKLMPDMMFIGTETLPFFRNDVYGNTSFLHKNPWFDVAENDFVLGQFIWPGIDYLGEAVWPARMWSGGIIDSTGRIKERGYLTQSLWSTKPMVHISIYDESAKDMRENGAWGAPPMAGHWNIQHKSRPFIKAFLFTNCEKAAVLVNEKLIKTIDTSNMENGYLEIYLPNIPGVLSAKGIIDEIAACEYILKTAGDPDHIEMALENDIGDECMDIAMVSSKVVDKNGVLCSHYDGAITFLASGAQIIATDSGDPTDHTPYKSNTRKPLCGRCTAFLKLSHKSAVNVSAQSGNMKESFKFEKK
jgi:beta-galactosidase